MINYFNFRKYRDKILITNDFGEWHFLSSEDFNGLVKQTFLYDSDIYQELKEKGFVFDNQESFLVRARDKYRSGKSYLFHATSLHIFVITNTCNMKCIYCQAQDSSSLKKGLMSYETAKKAVDIALCSPEDFLTFEFQGGEPLLNFDILKYIVEYSESTKGNKQVSYNIVSNLVMLTDEIIDFCIRHKISVSTSLDGPASVQNKNRMLISEEGSYDIVTKKMYKLRARGLKIGAIQTTTKHSLNLAREIIDKYIANGLQYIFIRPLARLGLAAEKWEQIGYSPVEFIEFYRQSLDYIIQLNLSGTYIQEGHASILLSKILFGRGTNYMELRSPCGAGYGQIAYYYDGNIYTCDEGRMLAEMGNKSFLIGNVNNTYEQLVSSKTCEAACGASVLESTPTCCDCVYQPYCGVCPVVNLATENNIMSLYTNNFHCIIFKGILDILFNYLYDYDEPIIDVFRRWLNG